MARVVKRRVWPGKQDAGDDAALASGAASPAAGEGEAEETGEPAAETGGGRGGVLNRVLANGGRRTKTQRTDAKTAAATLPDTGDPTATGLPPLTLLSEPPDRADNLSEGELDRLGEVLIRTLRTFKVEGEIAGRTTGPVVTQFEVVPAPGVKVNRIAALDADLALALRAPSIRIVAPIPGKGAVGVEVPNPEAEVVYLRRILETASSSARADSCHWRWART